MLQRPLTMLRGPARGLLILYLLPPMGMAWVRCGYGHPARSPSHLGHPQLNKQCSLLSFL